MRIFSRFLYALLAVGIFLWVFTYSVDMTANRYYENVFGPSLTDEDSPLPDFFYFYTSIPDFHKSDPIISIDVDGFEIRGYEVAEANINNDNELEVIESIYFIVYSDSEDLSKVDKVVLSSSTETGKFEFLLTRFKTLNILNGINDIGRVYLDKSLFLETNFDKIELVDFNENILSQVAFNLEEESFTIKENLELFYQSESKIPEADDMNSLRDENIGIKLIHIDEDTQLDGSVMLVNMVLYFVVLIITTYLVFFRRKKYD